MRTYTIIATGVWEKLDNTYLSNKYAIKVSADTEISYLPNPSAIESVILPAGCGFTVDKVELYVKGTIGAKVYVYNAADDFFNSLTGDIQIGAVELKNGVNDTRATIEAKGTTTAINMALVDENGEQITSFGSPSTIAEFKSPSDFNATYTSSTTITLSGLPFTISSSAQIVYIKAISSAGVAAVYVNGSGGVSMTISSNVLTISGAGTPFASGDVYEIGLNEQDKAYDPSTQSMKEIVLNPTYSRYTDYETLVTAQDLTDAYVDFGAEINMIGYNRLGIWVTKDVNDSLNVNLKMLAKYASAGTVEAEMTSGVIALRTTGPTDGSAYYEFDVGTVPYIQLQAIAGTLGETAGDLTIVINKFYK